LNAEPRARTLEAVVLVTNSWLCQALRFSSSAHDGDAVVNGQAEPEAASASSTGGMPYQVAGAAPSSPRGAAHRGCSREPASRS